MTTKEKMIAQGYPADWSTPCPVCGSYDCHIYADGVIVCFDCKKRFRKNHKGKLELIL